MAYRRQVFEQIGEFDTRFDACEDGDFNHRLDRAGLSCYLVPAIAVRYQPRATLRGLFRQLMRYGRGRVRLARKHPELFSLKSFLPALFVAGVVLGPLVCWWLPVLWPIYWGVLVLYGLAVLGFSLLASVSTGNWGTLFWLPAVFLTIHVGSGWGVLREFLGGFLRRS